MGQGHFHWSRLLRATLSNLTLNISRTFRNGTSTAFLGSLQQRHTIFIVDVFFPMSNLNLTLFILKLLPFVLSLHALAKCFLLFYTLEGSPQSLLFSWTTSEQPQCSQHVFTGEVLQSSSHFCGLLPPNRFVVSCAGESTAVFKKKYFKHATLTVNKLCICTAVLIKYMIKIK